MCKLFAITDCILGSRCRVAWSSAVMSLVSIKFGTGLEMTHWMVTLIYWITPSLFPSQAPRDGRWRTHGAVSCSPHSPLPFLCFLCTFREFLPLYRELHRFGIWIQSSCMWLKSAKNSWVRINLNWSRICTQMNIMPNFKSCLGPTR